MANFVFFVLISGFLIFAIGFDPFSWTKDKRAIDCSNVKIPTKRKTKYYDVKIKEINDNDIITKTERSE